VALPGGRTPKPVYEELTRRLLAGVADWSGVTLWLGDERCVPPDHEASNGALLRRTFGRLAAEGHTGPVLALPEGAAEAPRRAAERYGERMPPAFDLLVLGLGADGHTASLFPRSRALAEEERKVVLVGDGPPPHRRRLTITPPVLAAARRRVMIVTGEDKAAAVAAALQGALSSVDCPGRLARDGTWILDRAAAGALAPPLAPTSPAGETP
jgi:6-phosphogluconolactonase